MKRTPSLSNERSGFRQKAAIVAFIAEHPKGALVTEGSDARIPGGGEDALRR
jgi:hypothetical protein